MNQRTTIDVLNGETPPEGSVIVGYHITALMPGAKDREERYLDIEELGPDEDLAVRKATAGAVADASELISIEGRLGILGIWWLAGMQDGKRDTYKSLVPMFTNKAMERIDPYIKVEVELDADIDEDIDPEDPTSGAST